MVTRDLIWNVYSESGLPINKTHQPWSDLPSNKITLEIINTTIIIKKKL